MENKIFIIVGHYGSGKTEFAINFAYSMKTAGNDVAIADLDVVNPFFRSRGKKAELERDNISVYSSNFEDDPLIDVPAVSAAIQSFFTDNSRVNIVDVGGDAVGARAIGRYAKRIHGTHYEMWMVVNANRYLTRSAAEVVSYLEEIETACGLKVTGLVNNTHYLRETNSDDILNGDKLVRYVGETLSLPVKYVTYIKDIASAVQGLDLAGEHLSIDMQMREKWY